MLRMHGWRLSSGPGALEPQVRACQRPGNAASRPGWQGRGARG